MRVRYTYSRRESHDPAQFLLRMPFFPGSETEDNAVCAIDNGWQSAITVISVHVLSSHKFVWGKFYNANLHEGRTDCIHKENLCLVWLYEFPFRSSVQWSLKPHHVPHIASEDLAQDELSLRAMPLNVCESQRTALHTCWLGVYHVIVGDFRFSQRCCWIFKTAGMVRRVDW
jgi:hypothetical protein